MKGGKRVTQVLDVKEKAEEVLKQYADMIYRIAFQNLRKKVFSSTYMCDPGTEISVINIMENFIHS